VISIATGTKSIYYCEYGEKNTLWSSRAVARCLEEGDLKTVVVASSTDKTALALAEGSRVEHEIIDYLSYALMAYSWKASENVYGALDLLVVAFDAFRYGETASRWP